ncbi:hypothetical protein CHLNCDRAFT_30037 [Chlorella variabilis]|uniref:Pyruvate kinase n=1 Tax=Chlorella variabilis TaxID=554065 RepID=E1Z7Q4_CHLVA|nr:hypothetical protein CHLNCDRAFT_30037 [Chlorella variabilis]EFN57958.1 hypothetical protein CHLNCDRAFT_30037 [Chlorella variabilis]|eukprot:XP_005850060.1 hypothetical protein CHLNCDRAFT_30037 [Chlorella variabilis]
MLCSISALQAKPLAVRPGRRQAACSASAARRDGAAAASQSGLDRSTPQQQPQSPKRRVEAAALALAGGVTLSNGGSLQAQPDMDIDTAAFQDYRDNPPARKTKIVCTIGPTSCTREGLFQLADAGMSVVRLNMSHGDHASHKAVVDLVREYNSLGRGNLAVMLDTKGPEVRSGDLAAPLQLSAGDKVTFTIVEGADGTDNRIGVNYDQFVDDASVGDMLLVDGGIMSLQVERITDIALVPARCRPARCACRCRRRHLNIRGKSANLPAITDRDWADIRFGIEVGVDFYALSFVRDAAVIYELKDGTSAIGVLAKIESADSVEHLEEILDAVDGAMVARGDLGAELPVEEVPYWQSKIVQGCRRRGKPCIVATNMLESMIQNPTPTRAEVSDIAIAVREGADAVMLSGETAYGRFPFKSLDTMTTVARRTELSMLKYHGTRRLADQGLAEMFAYHAVTMANTLKTSLVVFSRKGNMPALLSHYRPDYPIYCFTENELVQRRMALYHSVTAIYMRFSEQQEVTFDRAIGMLKERGHAKGGQLVAIVQSGRQPIWRTASTHAIQVRAVPQDPAEDLSSDDEGGPVAKFPIQQQQPES